MKLIPGCQYLERRRKEGKKDQGPRVNCNATVKERGESSHD
jgi:hypothetical protein